MSALNWMVSGALPSSVSESAHASSGEAMSSSSSPVFAPAVVVGGVAGGAWVAPGAGAAVVAVCGLGVSVVGVPPPPHAARVSVKSVPSTAEQPKIRIVSPPGRGMGKRRGILTDPPQPVNVRAVLARVATLTLLLMALAPQARAVPTRGDLPVLVILAGFPDRPLAHDHAYFQTLVDRLVAYYTEVSSGRL